MTYVAQGRILGGSAKAGLPFLFNCEKITGFQYDKNIGSYVYFDNSINYVYTMIGGGSMYATIQKWGNSQGLRIPKILLETLGIQENDKVELIPNKDSITIRKVTPIQHKTLEERLVEFYGKPIEQIERLTDETEVEWGGSVGNEVW